MKTQLFRLMCVALLLGLVVSAVIPIALAENPSQQTAIQLEQPAQQFDPRIEQALNALAAAPLAGVDLAARARTLATGGIIYTPLRVDRDLQGKIIAIEWANTDQQTKQIRINSILAPLPPQITAAQIAHETQHLFDFPNFPFPSDNPANCWVLEFHGFYAHAFEWCTLKKEGLDRSGLTLQQNSDLDTLVGFLDDDTNLLMAALLPENSSQTFRPIADVLKERYLSTQCVGDIPNHILPPPLTPCEDTPLAIPITSPVAPTNTMTPSPTTAIAIPTAVAATATPIITATPPGGTPAAPTATPEITVTPPVGGPGALPPAGGPPISPVGIGILASMLAGIGFGLKRLNHR